jgi:hypothetical protein
VCKNSHYIHLHWNTIWKCHYPPNSLCHVMITAALSVPAPLPLAALTHSHLTFSVNKELPQPLCTPRLWQHCLLSESSYNLIRCVFYASTMTMNSASSSATRVIYHPTPSSHIHGARMMMRSLISTSKIWRISIDRGGTKFTRARDRSRKISSGIFGSIHVAGQLIK